MAEILQAVLLWSLKLQYVCSQIFLEVGLSAQCWVPQLFSMFWNFLDFSRPWGQKTGMSMSAINTFKQGHAFLIKCLQKWSKPVGGVGVLLDQAIKGISVMNHRKKRGRKNWAKGEREKKNERKGHEWQLIWGVSATPQRAMTSSGIELREGEKGFFKKLAAYRGRNYICAKHAQVLLCCGGNHFQWWGLECWINQLCLLWGLFITKIFLTKSSQPINNMFPVSPVLWRVNFLKVHLSFGQEIPFCCERKTTPET